MTKKFVISALFLLSSVSLSACDAVRETFGVANRVPVIASFDYNPKSGITKNDVITFSVVSNDPEGKPLQYNWTATKGILTANSGSTVSWRPTKLDNTFESGLTNVSVLVSDGVMTNTASVNIFINGETITVDSNPVISASPSPSPTAVPSVSVSPTPTAVPTAIPTAAPTVNPTPVATPTATATVTPVATPVPTPTSTATTVPVVEATPTASPTTSSTIIVTQ